MNTKVKFTWTREKRDALRKAYDQAVKGQQSVFPFEGDDMLVSYAKHLLEYLDNQFNRR